MRTIITVENGRVTVQVDNEQPINVSTPLPAPVLPTPPPETQKIDRPVVIGKRRCTICDDIFKPYTSRSKVCAKAECRSTLNRMYQQRYAEKRKVSKEKTKNEVAYCRHCCAWTTHDSEHHPNPAVQKAAPQFLPGHEKTPEEIASWKPAVSGVTPSVPNVATKTDAAGGFADPWNCDSCRRRSKLCPFHQGMADEGKQPPSHKVKRKV